jgi:hypothetical protein
MTNKKGNIMHSMTWETSTDTDTLLVTPTAQLTTLYAEYDCLLDALEVLQRKLTSIRRYNPLTRCKLRRQRDDLCEALADVHEKIADYDFVVM